MLELKNVNANYDFLQILWDVSLHVDEGEFVALVGPNGAGKTTTLRTIAGLLKPTGGDIMFQNRSLLTVPPHEIVHNGISFISESLNLFTDMSIRDNLLLGAYIIKDKQKILEVLDFVFELFPRLKERQGQLAGTLSGGERKMLAIARGIMSEPSMLLVDEPSLGLAPYLTVNVFNALKRLQETGVTILLVEQNVNTTLKITNRAYVLEQGQIVMEGNSTDLLKDDHIKTAYLGI